MKIYKEKTILDIARELNVSKSIVSRALNNHFSIGDATKKAVHDLTKNIITTPTISPIVYLKTPLEPLVLLFRFSRITISTVISGIEELAYKSGYKVIICQSAESYEREVIVSQALLSSKIDGLIVSISRETNNPDYFKVYQGKKVPIVFFDRVCPDLEVSNVTVDDYQGAFTVVEHLIKEGRRKIAHFAGPPLLQISIQRINGYKDALLKNGLPSMKSCL